MARLLGGLALQGRGRGEGGIRLDVVQLRAEEGLLLIDVALQRRNVCKLVGEVLRRGRVVDERMRDRLGVGRGRVESDGGRCQRIESLLALGREAGSQLRQDALVVLVALDLPL